MLTLNDSNNCPHTVRKLGDYAVNQFGIVQELQAAFDSREPANATLVQPVDNYSADSRRFLGVLATPPPFLIHQISTLQEELKKADRRQFMIPPEALHLTMKNIRTISDPPNFSETDVEHIQGLLPQFTANTPPIRMIGHGLLRTPTSCSVPIFTDANFGKFVCELDASLKQLGVPDDKRYNSTDIFFTNITIARYTCTPNSQFQSILAQFSQIQLPEFTISSVKLISSNLAFTAKWHLEFGEYTFKV